MIKKFKITYTSGKDEHQEELSNDNQQKEVK